MRKAKTKAASLPVPQSQEEANAQIRRIGALQIEVESLQLGVREDVAALNARYATEIDPRKDEIGDLTDGLRVWAAANRAALTNNGQTKTAKLSAGEIAWRARPPRVVLKAVETVLAAIRERGLTSFLRVKEEVDKAAMLADPDLARSIKGVSIASEGEDFVVTPYPTEGAVA